VVSPFSCSFGLLLALDGEEVASERDLDFLLVDARQLGGDDHFLFVLGHVHHGRQAPPAIAQWPRRATAPAVEEVVEHAVDLTAERDHWVEEALPDRRVCDFSRQGMSDLKSMVAPPCFVRLLLSASS
jgi:hypothetical protein